MAKTLQFPNFSGSLPKGWNDQTIPTFIGPMINDFQCNIVVSRVLQGERLGVETHAQKQIESLKPILKDYVVESQESITIHGVRAYKVIHSFDTEEGLYVKQVQWYIDHDGYVLTITGSAEKEAFESCQSDLEQFIDSLELL